MTVKLIAFFDARFQNSGPLWEACGRQDHWRNTLDAYPERGTQTALLRPLPGNLGTYDLAQPDQARRVVELARITGLSGFVLDCHPTEKGFETGAEALNPWCNDAFGLAFQWDNGPRPVGCDIATFDWETHRVQLRALIAAIAPFHHVRMGGHPVLVIKRPRTLVSIGITLAILREEAQAAGLSGLYLIANAADERGQLRESGFNSLLDPDPSEWPSCDRNMEPNGFLQLQIQAGREEPSHLVDTSLDYRKFICSRMANRPVRGKVLPRVIPYYSNWPDHLEGGCTSLVNYRVHWFRIFLYRAMAFVFQTFPADEQVVMVDSWNDWRNGTQLEPSIRLNDLMLVETQTAIEWGHYLTRTLSPHRKTAPFAMSSEVRKNIDQLCEQIADQVHEEARLAELARKNAQHNLENSPS